MNSLREDLGINFVTAQGWLEALERLYFIFRIRPYAGRLSRALRREEKVYLFDFSVIENAGTRFENLVALHLRKLCDAWTDWGFGDFALHYVRDREKREVDFVVIKDNRPLALFEAKEGDEAINPSGKFFAKKLEIPFYQISPHHMRVEAFPGKCFKVSASNFLLSTG